VIALRDTMLEVSFSPPDIGFGIMILPTLWKAFYNRLLNALNFSPDVCKKFIIVACLIKVPFLRL
ncbi:MAG: hypothetical protein RMK21_07565, partial [Aquificaceae bacterium]|nr:hypothetical protein [Aquificaceae bacterium]